MLSFSSESLINLFKPGKSAEELKKIITGISNIDNNNPNN